MWLARCERLTYGTDTPRQDRETLRATDRCDVGALDEGFCIRQDVRVACARRHVCGPQRARQRA